MSNSDSENNACRFCLEEEGQMISPCYCKGTMKYVHRECLNIWRSQNTNAFNQCTQCHFQYIIEDVGNSVEDANRRRRTYQLYVVRDIFVFILLLGLVIFPITGVCVYFLDDNCSICEELGIKNVYFGYYISGIIWFIAILGVVALLVGLILLASGGEHGNNFNHMRFGELFRCRNKACLIFLLVFGLFIAIYLVFMYIQHICNRHLEILWNYQQTQRLVVKDFNNREEELYLLINV